MYSRVKSYGARSLMWPGEQHRRKIPTGASLGLTGKKSYGWLKSYGVRGWMWLRHYPFRLASCGFVHAKRRPSICREGFWNYLKNLMAQFISYLAFTLMGWVSWPLSIFVLLASFSAVWWPNIWPKMGFRNFWHFPNFSYIAVIPLSTLTL